MFLVTIPRSPAGFSSPLRRSRVYRVFTFHIVCPAERFRLELPGVPYKKRGEAEFRTAASSELVHEASTNPQDHDANCEVTTLYKLQDCLICRIVGSIFGLLNYCYPYSVYI